MRTRVAAALVALALVPVGVISAAPGWAASGSPQVISVDCDLAGGVTATTITGQPGDTVTIDNTSGTSYGCTFASTTGVVTATNLTAGVLAVGQTSTVTIVAAGAFTITPRAVAGGGTTTTMTVVIGTPVSVPEYTITFDANGGSCSSNPLVITAASGEWYSLPTNGTGAFQCNRPNYQLIGWSRSTTYQAPGQAAQVPDLALPAPGTSAAMAAAADHVTLLAQWQPLGAEIVYDANVATSDGCYFSGPDVPPSLRQVNLPLSYRTTTEVVLFPSERNYRLDQYAPCTPQSPEGTPLQLAGWALTGDGPVAYSPLLPVSATGVKPQTSVTLYAVWTGITPCDTPIGPGVNLSNCTLTGASLAGANLSGANLSSANLSGANLSQANLSFANLSGANLSGANLYDANLAGANLMGANLSGSNLTVANLQAANLLGANLQNANLTEALLWDANLFGADLTGANQTDAQR